MSLPIMLIVEDEPLIRMCAVDFAEEAGYDAREAKDAAEALAVLESEPGLTVMLADISLPGAMNGLALVDLVSERWPGVRIVIASGALANLPADAAPGAIRLPKPYGFTHFVETLERIGATS